MEEDKFEKEEVAQFSDKRQLREQIAKDVEAFLRAGGEYTDAPDLDMSKYKKRFTRRKW